MRKISLKRAGSIAAIFALAPFLTGADAGSINTGSIVLIPVTPNVYAVDPQFAGAAGAVIVTDAGTIVVDTHGTPATAEALIRAVDGLDAPPIRYVINTHWHVDHHSGNEAYRSAFADDVVIISHDATREDIPTLGAEQFVGAAPYRTMAVDAANEQLQQALDAHGVPLTESQLADITTFRDAQSQFAERDGYVYSLPNVTFSQSVTIHGSPSAEVFFLHPAHTRGDAVVYLREQKVLVAGDLLTKPILWSWSSYPSTYVQTLRELEQLEIEKIIIGHGGPVLDGTNYLVLVREFLETIVAYVEQAGEEKLSVDEAIENAESNTDIQSFRRQFVADNEQENRMFGQMVGWTISRAYEELQSSAE
jgi:glyoxylase-like metal-dependent hydrolase (beta-lactamase superfamily II)